MSDQTRCLLDKVTARRTLEGLLKLTEARDLSAEEVLALGLFERASSYGLRHFLLPPTDSRLRRLEDRLRYAAIIRLFRQRVEVVFPTRYCKLMQDAHDLACYLRLIAQTLDCALDAGLVIVCDDVRTLLQGEILRRAEALPEHLDALALALYAPRL
jgi:hypothetical protein